MTFWNIVKGIGNYAVKTMQKKQEKAQDRQETIQRYKERFETYDDEKLLMMHRNSSGCIRIACGQILKERGYVPKSDE